MATKKKHQQQQGQSPEPTRITAADIQQKEFRMAMRGYHEQDVDHFLDEVTEEVARLYAENKRLHEELEFARTTRLDVGDAEAEAETLLRRAREEADRIVAEWRVRAAAVERAPAGPGPATAPASSSQLGPFISRERAFLQSLADLIQAHAEAVKQDLRRARAASGDEANAGHAGSGNEPSAPEPGSSQSRSGDQAPSVDVPTQAWAPPVPGPDPEGAAWDRDRLDPPGATGTGDRPRAAGREEIVDLTGGPEAVAAGPAPAGNPRGELIMEDDEEDRSIRELFWGED